MSRIGEIKRDNADGELAIVEDVEFNENGEVELRVSGSNDDSGSERGMVSEEEFDGAYPEHVIGRKEVWRLVKDCTPHWLGTDVEVAATTLNMVAWRVVRRGPLMSTVKTDGESEPLKRFLKRFRFMDYTWDKDSAPYEATAADRKAVEEFEKTGVKELKKALLGDAGDDIYETLASLGGVDTKKPITQEELVEGLSLAASMERPTGELLASMRTLGVDVDRPLRKIEEVPVEEQRKAIRAAVELRRMIGVAEKEAPDADTNEAKTAKLGELFGRLPNASGIVTPTLVAEVPGHRVPWQRGQVRRGDVMNVAKGGGPNERFAIGGNQVFTLIRPLDGDGGAQLWAIVYGEELPPEGMEPPMLAFRESWPNTLIEKTKSAGQSSPAPEQQTGTQRSEKGTSTMATKAKTSTPTPTEEAVAKAVAILSGSAADQFKDVTIARGGHQVVLPEGMTTKKGIEWLQRIDKEDDREVAINHEISCYPIEGAYALYRALKERYGFVSLASTPSFFGPKPPMMVGFDVSLKDHVQVPWGRLQIPGIAGYLETGATLKPTGEFRFVLAGQTQRRHEDEVKALVKLVKEFATTKSIYRGQAIRVSFPDPDNGFDFTYTPKFIDTEAVREEDLIFPVDVQEQVETSLYAPIEQTAACREDKVPLKRGILLEGPFGVGKTLAAYVTAKKCVRNGWTFMYLDKTSDLKQAIKLAEHYQPCAIFAEDIDREVDGKERTEEMDAILNTIDGIDSKGSEIIVVLTTNDVGKINRAMLRPGRLDAVIPVRAPDAIAARRLVVNYARNLLRPEEDLGAVGQELAGSIPAVIREVVERSKLAAIRRQANGQNGDRRLTTADLLTAARGMKAQVALMTPKVEDGRSDIEKAMTAGAEVLARSIIARWTPNVTLGSNGQAHPAALAATSDETHSSS